MGYHVLDRYTRFPNGVPGLPNWVPSFLIGVIFRMGYQVSQMGYSVSLISVPGLPNGVPGCERVLEHAQVIIYKSRKSN